MLTHFFEPELLEKERMKGFIEGEQKGEIKGEIRGEIKGEIKGKLEVAGKMLTEGLAPELIRKLTGLSEEELLHLQATNLHGKS